MTPEYKAIYALVWSVSSSIKEWVISSSYDVFTPVVRFIWISDGLHFSFGSVWYHTGVFSSEPQCINKSHVGPLIPFIGQKWSRSNPLSFNRLLKIWALHNAYVFSSCWAVWSSAQKSRSQSISSLLPVNPPSTQNILQSCRLDLQENLTEEEWFRACLVAQTQTVNTNSKLLQYKWINNQTVYYPR